jgi:DNA repair protein RadA/Sms
LLEETVLAQDESRKQFFKEAPVLLKDIELESLKRLSTQMEELNRVLGGGVVPGSVILIGGSPGIGKSTLCLQASNSLSRNGNVILYVSGEESAKQTKLRAGRLGEIPEGLYVVSQTDLSLICEHIEELKPRLVVIDSIQVMYKPGLASSAGSVSQVRECAQELTMLAKSTGISIILIGHVTKEGTIAGPRVLEHIVDTVLYFEGEKQTVYRILRATKNRFGSTDEIGVFEMTGLGLKEVHQPSEFFLSERPVHAAGSVVVPVLEGSRPVLVEIQALVSSAGVGIPRRRSTGIDYNRLSMLVAILEKRLGLRLNNQDIFVNVAGGIKVEEPACDLGIALAVSSSYKDRPLGAGDIFVGEVGLASEVRNVTNLAQRCQEAERFGFKRAILPATGLKNLRYKGKLQLVGVNSVSEALKLALK